MSYLMVYLLLVGLAWISWPLWRGPVMRRLKGCKSGPTPPHDPPSFLPFAARTPQYRSYDGPPKLAEQSDEWRCEVCGHDKYVVFATADIANALRRRCVRCRAEHGPAPYGSAGDEGWCLYKDGLPKDEPPRLTGQLEGEGVH